MFEAWSLPLAALIVAASSIYLTSRALNRTAQVEYVQSLERRVETLEHECQTLRQENMRLNAQNYELMKKVIRIENGGKSQ